MTSTTFNSSFLTSATYDSLSMIATVTIGSRVYNYLISSEMWLAWLAADSADSFFNRYIRDFII